MANDRLFLFHRETRKAVMIAKSYDGGWIGWANDPNMDAFFDELREWLSEDQEIELVRESDLHNFPTCLNLVQGKGPRKEAT